jgi:hypothetical protein
MAMFKTINLARKPAFNNDDQFAILFAASTTGHLHTFHVSTKETQIVRFGSANF